MPNISPRAPVRSRPLADWRGREEPADVREKIIGENTLRHINFLEKALEAARAVVRLTVPTAAGAAYGSGFLVAPDLVMTNHHVIGTREQGERSEFTFGYQIDRTGAPGPIVTVGARAQGAFHTTAELDYTVVEIEGRPDFCTPCPCLGFDASQAYSRVSWGRTCLPVFSVGLARTAFKSG